MNILIVDEPTRGVDVKAKSEIFKLLLQQKQLGKGILVYSPETRELLNICDRLFIVVNGSIVEEIQRNDRCFNEKHILEVIHATRSELSDQI
jgi:ABC-type sugar transport system ATPase subunit